MTRTVTTADVPAVARALAAAFLDDPQMRWVFRDDARRLAQLERGYPVFLARAWLPHGEAFTDDARSGAAVWVRPGEWHLGPLAQLRMLPAVARIARGDLARLMKVSTFLERRHPRRAHWYLPMVGVAPAGQGRGLGAALMRPVLDRCDAEGVPAYLEASSARSRPLYERLGFVVTDELRYAADGPPLWAMWREPA